MTQVEEGIWEIANAGAMLSYLMMDVTGCGLDAGLLGYKHIETGVRMLEDGSGFKFTNALNEDVKVVGGPQAKWSPRNVRLHLHCHKRVV
jgi:hypothetical protein